MACGVNGQAGPDGRVDVASMSASSAHFERRASDSIQRRVRELEGVGSAPETIYEALIECVRAAGGSKVVAAELWPAVANRSIEEARRRLANCLSPERAEKLALDEVIFVLRLARKAGCHVGMSFLSRTLGYAEPMPFEPEDERAKLQREFITATRELASMAQRIEQLGTQADPGSVR
ncbi:MAG: hypothetical protein KF863_21565 [Rubrivivax sp.]|nr:hypothetical protein [Rubrivivax sp.]